VPTESSTIGIVLKTGTVAVELQQIPNQPIIFKADPSHAARSEDDIIAWVWRIFIETNGSDPHILLRLPMTKAAVRAMDATEQFLRQQEVQVPEKWIVAGGSKRGWTSKLFS
jgi:PhoPQ-activated pathogenicity-related protein